MTSCEIWEAFEDAYELCPHTQEMYDDQYEHPYGQISEIKSSKTKAVRYWMDPESIGGRVLWARGWARKLDPWFLDRVKAYQKDRKKAERKLAKKYF